ncbi:YbaK/EbsC family protein [Sphingomonas ginkgonis]|uniref:YbaK/EbsC family protein n=1 Tax=Sphingomonas ginkgonis TaxID=2315330 RepID=A0A3R9WNU4_9SPHN|nr:YbaK/EbsC family protein [Sphingomonas ginkgonis]RST30786.1 YbaK/EbsC family protein [Sphingomonas ginkgonis]
MSDRVAAWLRIHAPELRIIGGHASTATVDDAAAALGIEPARVAKSLAVRAGERVLLLVTRGDARLDNRKFKDICGTRPRMLDPEETHAVTGHPVGGVCPFALASALEILCDVSLRRFATVFPAAGSRTSSVEVAPERLAEIAGARWVDVCRLPEASGP